MIVGIHGKKFKREDKDFLKTVFDLFSKKASKLLFSPAYLKSLLKTGILPDEHGVLDSRSQLQGLDVMITLGGDGTLLEAVALLEGLPVPVWGINLGRMGFLATTARETVETTLQILLDRKFEIEERTMLSIVEPHHIYGEKNFGLNDFTILKKDTSSMILVHAYIDDTFLNSYWADGIIVSTPTGSTGYSLSCGGPMVLPGSRNFVITPVSPHNLTARPMVVPDDSKIHFRVEARSKQYLTSLDSRFVAVPVDMEFTLMKSEYTARLIKVEGDNYFKTIRQKLNWGVDYRN